MPGLSLNRLRSRFQRREQPAAQIFSAPPFTQDLADAVRVISTRLAIRPDEKSRGLWERECNRVGVREAEALQTLFADRPKPKKILEIGPGLGRSVITLAKSGLWDSDAEVFVYDADGKQTKYKQNYYDAPPQWPDVSSFCGNFAMLHHVLEHNGVRNVKIVDARTTPLGDAGRDFDLIYAMYSVGFHWSLEHYLADIDRLLAPDGLFVGTLNKHYKPFPALESYRTKTVRMEPEPGRFVTLLALQKR